MNAVTTAGAFAGYTPGRYFCEMLSPVSRADPLIREVGGRFDQVGIEELRARSRDAETELYNLGITFTVYSQGDAIDRILPFDVVPRVISTADWAAIEKGVVQRVTAINLFLADVYGAQKALKDGIVPADLVLGNANYQPAMQGLGLPFGTYVHINGTDLVRNDDGRFHVLEDNARTPSGVSYVVENRHLMLRTFSDLMHGLPVRPVGDYGRRLHEALCEVAPAGVTDPQVALLSPGVFNSAYFEHVFLAREMGVPLVEGRDLLVENDRVFMRTVAGHEPVDVLYRRLNDDFLDPEVFNPESLLGVPGIMRAYRKGTVALANAPGTGVADDKAVYAYLPRLIRYYLDEAPVLDNVETHICREADGLGHTLSHLADLVVKPVGELGGYGITIGPRASAAELERCRARLVADPANYISQPMVNLSVSPTLVEAGIEPRHVDLRPFAVTGRSTWVLPGGLSRVALSAAPWSSTARRAAARRIPGSLTRLLSRYAEAIFWLARYVERAENMARVLDVQETFARDSRGTHDWRAVLALYADEPRFLERYPEATPANVIYFYALDLGNPGLDPVEPGLRARQCPHPASADLDRDVGPAQHVPPARRRPRALGARRGAAQPSLRHDQGGLRDPRRHHRRHLLPRRELAFLPAGCGDRARRPDHPAPGCPLPQSDDAGGRTRRCQPVERGPALGGRLSRLPASPAARHQAAAGGGVPARRPAFPPLGGAQSGRGRRPSQSSAPPLPAAWCPQASGTGRRAARRPRGPQRGDGGRDRCPARPQRLHPGEPDRAVAGDRLCLFWP